MDKRVERNKVQSSFKLNIPKHLIISAKNLQMEETIGQGQRYFNTTGRRNYLYFGSTNRAIWSCL